MKIGAISIKENTTAKRFDASFHLSDGKNAIRSIEHAPYPLIKVGDAAQRIWHAGRWRRVYVNNHDHGIILVGSSAMLKADLSDEKMVSRLYTEDIDDKTLKKGWILISCSGTIGNCAFTNAQHAEKLASQDVIRINPNNILRAGVLYAYLSTSYGYNMLTQGTFGAVIQHIEPQHVERIPIPKFPEDFQKKVDDLIQEAARLREEAAEKFNSAKEKLSSAFTTSQKVSPSKFKTSKVSYKDVWNSLQHRLDPPALMNDGVSILNELTFKYQYKLLGHTGARVRRPGIFKRNYVGKGYPYIKGSDIFDVNPFMRCQYLSKTQTPFVGEMLLHEGQILLTCAGSVGSVKMITKEYDDKGALGSQDIIRIESNDNLYTKEYLFAYLQLPFVYDYIQSMKYGSVIERIEPFHVESIPVLTPTKELSNEITKLVKEYMDCTYSAFCKEEEAISMVEKEIESWHQ